MANSIKKTKGTSWTWVILMLFIFFPVGIPMLIKKVKSEKFAYDQNGKTMVILGWIFMFMGVYYMFSSFTGKSEFDSLGFVLALFFGGGAVLVYYGKKLRNRASRIARYMAILHNQNECYIDVIAQTYPTSFDNACRNLQYMIDEGFLMNSYLDLPRGKLVINNQDNGNQTNESIKCSSCGANIKIAHEGLNQCEYCGSNNKA